jgi:hypothetical protein
MTSAVLLEGCVVQLWRGSPKFEPFAMLGGVIWYVESSLGRPSGVPAGVPDSRAHEPPRACPLSPDHPTPAWRPHSTKRGARRFFFPMGTIF